MPEQSVVMRQAKGEVTLQVGMGFGDGNQGQTQSIMAKEVQALARKPEHGSATTRSTAPMAVAELEVGAPSPHRPGRD